MTLYQTVSGGNLPFLPHLPKNPLDQRRFLLELRSMHESAQIPRLRSPFWPLIEKCLAKDPNRRFADIREFRAAVGSVAKANNLKVPRQAEPDDDIWSYRDKGNTLLRLGKYEEAITAFDTFRARIPDDFALFNKAVCLENLGRLNEAMDIYWKFIEQKDFKACINAANCLRRLGEHDSALEFALRATQLEPDDADCWIALGNAKYAIGLFPEAVVAYCRAVTISPTEATPHYNMGLAGRRLAIWKEQPGL